MLSLCFVDCCVAYFVALLYQEAGEVGLVPRQAALLAKLRN